jgi:hypothetical protein
VHGGSRQFVWRSAGLKRQEYKEYEEFKERSQERNPGVRRSWVRQTLGEGRSPAIVISNQ